MDKEHQIKFIQEWLEQRGIPFDLVDLNAEVDSYVELDANLENIKELIGNFTQTQKEVITDLKSPKYEEQNKQGFDAYIETKVTDTDFKAEWLNNNKPIAICGETNSGKTNLAFFLANLCKHKNKYVLGYPKKIKGFIQLNSVDDLAKISEGVLLIDEFSIYFPVWDKRSNEKLLDLLQFTEHNNIKLILSTQLSQFITKQCEALIPCWAIKQINIRRLKNGSTPSYILKHAVKHPNISSDFMKVATNQFLWFNEQGAIGENGVYTFPDMNIKKDWGNENADKNAEQIMQKKPTDTQQKNGDNKIETTRLPVRALGEFERT